MLVRTSRLLTVVDPVGIHSESAWRDRLPAALTFLLSPWWGALVKGHEDDLFFTVPRRLRAGQAATILVNAKKSDALASACGSGRGGGRGLRFVAGYNGWSSKVEAAMTSLAGGSMASTEGSSALEDWHAVRIDTPQDAYELSFALSDEKVGVVAI